MREENFHTKNAEAVKRVRRHRRHVQNRQQHRKRNGLVAPQKKRNHDSRLQQNPRNVHQPLKHKIFIRRDDRAEYRERERQREIPRQKPQNQTRARKLFRRHRRPEHRFGMRAQKPARRSRQNRYRAVKQQKQAEHLVLLAHLPLRAEFRRETNHRVPEPEVKQRQIRDHRGRQRIQSELRLPHLSQHERRVHHAEKRRQKQRNIRQNGSRANLVHPETLSSFPPFPTEKSPRLTASAKAQTSRCARASSSVRERANASETAAHSRACEIRISALSSQGSKTPFENSRTSAPKSVSAEK